MSMPAVIELPELGNDLSIYSTKELRQSLSVGLELTAFSLTRLAAIWKELESRGEDLTELRIGLAKMLPMIAAGRLAAEAVVAFAGRPRLLNAMDGLPLNEQRELARGKVIDVVVPTNTDKVEQLPLSSLPSNLASLVIWEGRIRSVKEQRIAHKRHKKHLPKEERILRPHFNKQDATIKVGHNSVRLDEILDELAGPDTAPMDIPEEWGKVDIRLTKKELKALNNKADKLGLPAWELVRKAVRAFGLIS